MSQPQFSSLCAGYEQVSAFDINEEYEEEEISYVTLDLGNVDTTLIPNSSTYRLIGLDTPTPFLQLSGTVLKGRHDEMLGTELLFVDEGKDRNRSAIMHVANTEQRISFKQVQLQPKSSVSRLSDSGARLTVEQITGNAPILVSKSKKEKVAGKNALPHEGQTMAMEDVEMADDVAM